MKPTEINPLSQIKDIRIMIHVERYKSLPRNPMKTNEKALSTRTTNFHRFTKAVLLSVLNNTVLSIYSSLPPYQNNTKSIDIKVTIPDVTRDQDDTSKKLLTLSYIDDVYPQDTWKHIQSIYTDESATDHNTRWRSR